MNGQHLSTQHMVSGLPADVTDVLRDRKKYGLLTRMAEHILHGVPVQRTREHDDRVGRRRQLRRDGTGSSAGPGRSPAAR